MRPHTFALSFMLGSLTALGPLSTDMYLPALPALAADMGADVARAQLTLSAFLLGFVPGQIFYGPLADRLGRKRVIMAGMALFVVATLVCVVAPDIETMIVARFAQALGAAGPIVLARSMARDLYHGRRAAQELSRMAMILGVVPAIAPLGGGLINSAFGWQGVFAAILLTGMALAAVTWTALPETLPAERRATDGISILAIGRDFRAIGGVAAFRSYVIIVCMTYGGLFAFISGSPFILQEMYGLDPVVFAMVFGLCSIAFVSGTLLGQRLTSRRGIEAALAVGCWLLAIGGTLQLVLVLIGFGHPAEVIAPQLVFTMGVGVALPIGMSGAMMPFANKAGAASSLMGVVQMSVGAAVGILVGTTLNDSAVPLSLALTATGIAALIVCLAGAKTRRAELAENN